MTYKQYFVDEFIYITKSRNISTDLYYKTNGWKVVITKNLIKTAIVAPLLLSIFLYLELNENLSSIILPTVLPMLFDIENVEITRKEEEILLKLPIKKNRRKFETTEDWYNSLPKKIKKEISEIDFKDFIDKLVLAGVAVDNKKGKYKILDKNNRKFKITFY
ncbi:hypothetical protein GO730_39245 [Spirosoma sp. HMF3257]|uniref:Uncharacterized protein n=1 Tax=Spirosoma telluris TaxID=2183553 RepID=A0A327NK56_9BACT|nr:hypothetical protein [Spirosoma telluris]RAI72928.1 hypothetical protein HMF3257_39185 [Spirosoma telluris]